MILYLILLFLAAFIPGFVILKRPGYDHKILDCWLIFAGSYIFSITIVHLMPELYQNTERPQWIAMFILLGFFMQILIDFLTSGVEHGHAHPHLRMSVVGLMVGLSMHAIMDGAILVDAGKQVNDNFNFHGIGLLTGIVTHKIPAAVVLMTVLSFSIKNKNTLLALLLIFCLASPIGLLSGSFLYRYDILSSEAMTFVFAIVSGNFLHISTTIYFESSPHHHFNWRKFNYALLGALLAVAIEMLH